MLRSWDEKTPIDKFKCHTNRLPFPLLALPHALCIELKLEQGHLCKLLSCIGHKLFWIFIMLDVGLSFNSKNKCEQMFWISLYFVKAKLRQKCVCSLWRGCCVFYDPISPKMHVGQQFIMVIG